MRVPEDSELRVVLAPVVVVMLGAARSVGEVLGATVAVAAAAAEIEVVQAAVPMGSSIGA